MYLIIFMCHIFWVCLVNSEQPLVTTPLGAIRGHYVKSYGGQTFSAFEGIPYAKPPVGNLRFEEPQEIQPWSGVWDATTVHTCIHLNWPGDYSVIGHEDCLYINVYIPKKQPSPTENLDVVVHMHGGAFMIGYPGIAGPEYLMDRDIIYVNLNYRLGALGFLSTEDDVVSGNNGLKDQAFALKWVKNNIKYFGGNPNSVTIVGESAGASSVHFHYFSKLSKGLFHRGISHSGTALVPWGLQEKPLSKAIQLAASVGCHQHSTKDIVKCMKERSATDLIKNVKQFYTAFGYPFAPFAPVVEKEDDNAFLTNYPYQLLKNGQINDVPWVSTVTTEEGIFPAVLVINLLDIIDTQWNEIMPHILDYNYTTSISNKDDISQKIRQFYFEDKKVSLENLRTLIKLFSDRHFHIDFEKAAQLQAKVAESPVYTAYYGYKGKLSVADFFAPNLKEDYGVGHADDSFLVYYPKMPGMPKQEKLATSDELMKDVLADMITSFAKHGKPEIKGVEWKPLNENTKEFEHLFIRKPNQIEMTSKPYSSAIKFWNSLSIQENENIGVIKDEL